ncbi:MAG: 1-(5-phosphoribosyl)-5-((5-phosphoribosylamino)methylideneamino)imidazole-4-carboxamide isomerase [Deltaproteobacteria bacterium]|nr:MAG: 1-(5-phosphoribosyl)-5-((5-phosphoribosylamino)methylideneamino)imidazole-4-carboxamide isomerase [Deltaproteobacteria bacterium]
MIVIPAIDIKGGRCVRLKQGRMGEETVFSDIPEEMALKWLEQGAERLHIVDLDGAVRGKPVNRGVIKRIVDAVPVPVELGGGIRDMDTVKAYFDLGIRYLILGTVACKNPGFVREVCLLFPDRVILGIDARDNRVAVEGWTEEVSVSPVEMARRFEDAGISSVIYTDIRRDGMRTGPNIEATRTLARAVHVPVIASGGISDIMDVKNVTALSQDGVIGMITGRALYDGSLKLSEAIRVSREGS